MWLSLSDRATMWFLGEPKNIKINLNYKSKGPVEVDFESLLIDEQRHILLSMKQGILVSDLSFQDLLAIYKKREEKEKPVAVVENPAVKEQELAEAKKEKELLKIEANIKKRVAHIEKTSKWLGKQSMKAIQSFLQKEKDVKMLRACYEEEKVNKNRGSVLRLIDTKIRKCQKEVIIEIDNSEIKGPIQEPKSIFPGDVVDSEENEIVLTTEQLQKLAAGQGLGGE